MGANQAYNSNNFAFLLHFLTFFFFFPGTEISSMAVNKQLASSPVTISEKREFPVPENFTTDKRDTGTADEEWRSVGPLLVPFPQHCCEACVYGWGG